MILLTKIKLKKWCTVKSNSHPLGDCYFNCVGLGIGDLIQIIRKSPFNGALHIKNNLNAEFAIDSETASQIYVEYVETQDS